jgi:hypothetical protein
MFLNFSSSSGTEFLVPLSPKPLIPRLRVPVAQIVSLCIGAAERGWF